MPAARFISKGFARGAAPDNLVVLPFGQKRGAPAPVAAAHGSRRLPGLRRLHPAAARRGLDLRHLRRGAVDAGLSQRLRAMVARVLHAERPRPEPSP